MRRRTVVVVSLIAIAAVLLAVAIFPTLYPGQLPVSTTTARTIQCQGEKADPNVKYPLIMEMWNPAGDHVKGAWIVLLDEDRGIPFEEGYIRENGTYISRHSYSPSQNMKLLIQNDQTVEGQQNYVVEIQIPDVVCEDGYIHLQVNAS